MKKRTATQQCHAWIFTINNYEEADEKAVLSLRNFSSYLVCGKEVGDKKGVPHLQGYVYMTKKASCVAMSRVLKRAFLRASKGSEFDSFGYCGKQGLWLEHGMPPCQGQRSDLMELQGLTTMREVAMTATSVQGIQLMQKKLEFLEPKRDFLPTVIWIYGPTGVGKTRTVYDSFGIDAVHKQTQFKWWQGYDGHDVVILDDFRADFCKFHELLTLVDRYPHSIECKGGSRQLRARWMFITSPYSPYDVYKSKTAEDVKQLLRRLKHILYVDVTEAGDSIYRFVQNTTKFTLVA